MNERVANQLDGVTPVNIFSMKEENGTQVFTCHVCEVKVSGKKTLDGHRLGKKHSKNMENQIKLSK